MSIGWQDLLALAVVVAAAVCLVRRVRRSASNRTDGCWTCGGCQAPPPTQTLISLDRQYEESRGKT